MHFLGLNLYHGRYSEFLDILKHVTQKTLVFTPNPEILVRASRDSEFLSILKQATYNTPDANGLYLGSLMQEGRGFFASGIRVFFQKQKMQEQYGELIKGSDLTRDIFAHALQTGEKVLMLDSYRIITPENPFEIEKQKIQATLGDRLKSTFPWLDIHLFFDGEKSPEELAKYIEENNIVYVFSCLGMKKQELRLLEIFLFLPETQKVVGLGVGASIDFLLGLQKRAPLIFQKLGLEWLYRLILEPRKRYKRIYMALVEFPQLIKNSQEV